MPRQGDHTVITRYWRPPAAIDFNGEYSDMKLLAPAEVEIMKVKRRSSYPRNKEVNKSYQNLLDV